MTDPRATTPLSENESKSLLASYGVPVISEGIAATADEAVALAEKFGYPVVVKGHGAALTHKTEVGVVKLSLTSSAAVISAVAEIESVAGDGLEGFLVSPMATGKREFVAGLHRDPVFGPVVMFGLGGIFTEALGDVSFRLAPLTPADVKEMLSELRAGKLLGAFRGESPVKVADIEGVLLGLSRLATERQDIVEVDINPLIASPEGDLIAVDALVVTGEKAAVVGDERPPVSPKALYRIFTPRTVAIVGASDTLGKWGYSLATSLLAGGFKGESYLVNPRVDTLFGREVYKSVADIPGTVDLAVVCIPAGHILDLIDDLEAKSVNSMVLISSDFAETGEEGRLLEEKVTKKAREAGIAFIGPNTMGIQSPHADLYVTGIHVRPEPGTTAMLTQSGNMGVQLLSYAKDQGIGIRVFCGSGNEAMVSVEDFMEGFEEDDLTETVLLYVESVKDGPRFFEAARRCSAKKPVILLKGGRTEAGAVAAASHTGAMASNYKVFEAMCRQAGILNVRRPVEMLDTSAVFSSLPLPKGKRVAIMTLGGGWGVVTSDLCNDHNLEVPPLSEEVIAAMDKVLPPYWSRCNPVDLVGEQDAMLPFIGLEELAKWDGCDAIIHLGIMGKSQLLKDLADSALIATGKTSSEELDYTMKIILELEDKYEEHVISLMEKYDKPIVGVTMASSEKKQTVHRHGDSKYSAVFFPSPERAVAALAHMCCHSDFVRCKG